MKQGITVSIAKTGKPREEEMGAPEPPGHVDPWVPGNAWCLMTVMGLNGVTSGESLGESLPLFPLLCSVLVHFPTDRAVSKS